jgi:hypothetical protein
MAFDTLENATFSITMRQTARKSSAGLKPRTEQDTLQNVITWTLGTGAGQINEVYAALLTIAASGNQVLDLTALIDTLGNAWAATGIKSIFIQLLGATDTAPDGVTVGNGCTGITVGNNATNPWSAAISDQATGTITLANGAQFGRARYDAAGWVVDATHKSLKILNNDAVNPALVLIGLQGK